MMTLRDLQNVTRLLISRIPDDPSPVARSHGQVFGSDQTLERTLEAHLPTGHDEPAAWFSALPESVALMMKLRLLFALELFRQMEAAEPDLPLNGELVTILIRHAVLDQWALKGEAWFRAEFGPGRKRGSGKRSK